jgi:NADH-quinone oxidoreductase subunit L
MLLWKLLHISIILFPIISCLVASCGHFLGTTTVGKFSVIALGVSAMFSLFALIIQMQSSYILSLSFGTWFHVTDFDIIWTLYFDSVSCTMCLVITFISFLVHFYSLGYLSNDPGLTRFLAYLSLFTVFMLTFVLSINYIQMFIGWEGVGLVSYLLINFWYDREPANRAAFKAIIMNRVGDFFFLLAILFIWSYFGTIDLRDIEANFILETDTLIHCFGFEISKLTVIGFCLLIAAFVKSAQFGFHTWLADAMEGPTPVSALLHAATMVTAGVFLVIRNSYLFSQMPTINNIMLIIAAITTFFASFVAFFQYDLKKIIAYSTCAQLGLMFVACSLNQYILALFHLFNHAFFKALLFLCAGIIIHGANDEQDLRKFGNFIKTFPVAYKGFFIGSLALMGFPGLSGYYSKDAIFETLLVHTSSTSFYALILVSLGTFFTAAYSGRVFTLGFFNEYGGNLLIRAKIHETQEIYLIMPIIILIICTMFAGIIFAPYFLDPQLSIFKISFVSNYTNLELLLAETLPSSLKILPLNLTILGFIFGCTYGGNYLYYEELVILTADYMEKYDQRPDAKINYNNFIAVFSKAFNFDNFYYTFLVKPLTYIAYTILYKHIEKGLLEYFGPTGIKYAFNYIAARISHHNKVSLSSSLLVSFFCIAIITAAYCCFV